MRRRITLLYAVLAILVVQILVLVLFVEDLGHSNYSQSDFEVSERAAAPYGLLHGKRAPRVILESYEQLKNSRGRGFSTALLHRLPAVSDAPTLKSSAASISKQARPIVPAGGAGLRSRPHTNQTSPVKPKFVFQTATVVKANASPMPVHDEKVSEEPGHAGEVDEKLKLALHLQKQRKHNEEQLKPSSRFQNQGQSRVKELQNASDLNQQMQHKEPHGGQSQAKEMHNDSNLNQQKQSEEQVNPPSKLQDQIQVKVEPERAKEQPSSALKLQNQQKHEKNGQAQSKMQAEKQHVEQLKHTPLELQNQLKQEGNGQALVKVQAEKQHEEQLKLELQELERKDHYEQTQVKMPAEKQDGRHTSQIQKKQLQLDKVKKQELSKTLTTPKNQGELEKDRLIHKQREERLKPPSMLKTFGGDSHLDEEAMRRDMERRDQQRRAELFERAMEEKKDREKWQKDREKQQEERRKEVAHREKQRRIADAEKRKVERQKYIKTYLEEEKKRAKQLNELWEQRKKEAGGDEEKQQNLEQVRSFNPLSAADPQSYFRELCETTKEPYVECSNTPVRDLTASEAAGSDIMFTMRTTLKYHNSRLPVLFDTWLSEIEPTSVFIVTDGDDEDLIWNTRSLGMHYVNIESYRKEPSRHDNQTAGTSHGLSDLCCKAGVELELLMAPENSKFNWLCHVDDDMYVNLKPLVTTLAHFDPRKEAVYFGNSGTTLDEPRQVRNDSLLGRPGTRYHFAVGGMYCLSRVMLEQAAPYLVGCNAFRKSCSDAKEPEDVTVGLIVGAVLNKKLHRTSMIYTHGLDLLSGSPTIALREQIAFSYGYGADGTWSIIPNVIYVPGGLFNIDEDISQFRSLHCYFYPTLSWCVEKKQDIVDRKKRGDVLQCPCEWKKLICCQVYKDNYHKFMEKKMRASREADQPPDRLTKEKKEEKG